jgi:hypothetical protein
MSLRRGIKLKATLGGIASLTALLSRSSPGSDFPVYWIAPLGEGFRASAGDVDGDGFADLLLTSGASPSSPQNAFVRSGVNGALLRTWTPSLPTFWAFQGNTDLKPAGDLNLDGFGDIALSIMNPSNFSLGTPVEVRSGSDGSVMAMIPSPPVSNALVIGSSIAGVGDLDGDGFPELLIRGDYLLMGCFVGHGVYDFEGPGFGLQSFQVAWQCSQEFGSQIGRLDDVDGDGLPDFYVGAPRTSSGGLNDSGWIGIFSGATGMLSFSLNGSSTSEYLGGSVAALSDVTGDGMPEIAVARAGGINQVQVLSLPSFGVVYALSAPTLVGEVDALGDADGDGLDDFLVRWSTGVTGTPTYSEGITAISGPTGTVIGRLPQNLQFSFVYPWGALGDVNGDGLGDFAATPGLFSFGTVPPIAVQGLWSPWSWPNTDGVTTVYVAPNLGVVGTPAVGGTAQFQVVAPKHAGRPFQVVFSQEYASPALPLGPFLFPLMPDAVLFASLAAGIGGTLNATGQGSVTVPVPNNPALQGLWLSASGVVYDPTGPLGIGCVLTQVGFQIQ